MGGVNEEIAEKVGGSNSFEVFTKQRHNMWNYFFFIDYLKAKKRAIERGSKQGEANQFAVEFSSARRTTSGNLSSEAKSRSGSRRTAGERIKQALGVLGFWGFGF